MPALVPRTTICFNESDPQFRQQLVEAWLSLHRAWGHGANASMEASLHAFLGGEIGVAELGKSLRQKSP